MGYTLGAMQMPQCGISNGFIKGIGGYTFQAADNSTFRSVVFRDFRACGLQMSHGDNGNSLLFHFVEKLFIKLLDSL